MTSTSMSCQFVNVIVIHMPKEDKKRI